MTASPEVRMAKAQEYLDQAKVYEALAVLETLVQDHPAYFQGYIQLGLLNFKLGAIARGREWMQKALAVAPAREDQVKIHAILREQDKLDKDRYHRPDFEALRKPKQKGADDL